MGCVAESHEGKALDNVSKFCCSGQQLQVILPHLMGLERGRMKNGIQILDCSHCHYTGFCCREGAWVDLEEAKKILNYFPKAEFHHFKIDKDFPSGFCVATCHGNEPCFFIDNKGLCKIHKIDYKLKPSYCKEFPMEDGKLSFFKYLCPHIDRKTKRVICEGQ